MYRSALLLVAVGFAGCAEPQPPEFLSKEHAFRVRFGSPPKVEEMDGRVHSAVYSVRSQDGLFSVVVTDMPRPDGDPADRVPLYLTNARDDLMRATGGTLTADDAIVLAGKYPGRALTARVTVPQPGALRSRLYFVGKRLYQVTVLGTDEFINTPAATAFLESFTVSE